MTAMFEKMSDMMGKMSDLLNLLTSSAASSRLQPTIATSASAIGGPGIKVNNSLPFGAPSFLPTGSADLYSQVHATRALHMMQEKDFHAVIERLEEPEPNEPRNIRATYAADDLFIRKICTKGHLDGFVESWRHPGKNPALNRIVKVRFRSPADRDSFIRSFRMNLPPNVSGRPRVRRDMTPPELQLLFQIRKQAWELNQVAGFGQYFVRDLELIKNSNNSRYGRPNPTPISSSPAPMQ